MNSWVVAKLTFKEAMHDRVFYGLFLSFGLIILSSTFSSHLALREGYRVVFNLSFTAMTFLGEFLALFYGCFTLFKELERKTLSALLTRSVLRYQFVLGKFIGVNLLLLVVVVLSTLLLYGVIYLNLLPGVPNELINWNIPKAILLLSVELMLLTAMALFFSIITSSPLNCLFFTLIVFVVGLYNDILRDSPEIAYFGRVQLNAVSKGIRMLSYVWPNFQCFDISQQVNAMVNVPWTYVGLAMLYGVVYTGVFLLSGMLIFSRRSFA